MNDIRKKIREYTNNDLEKKTYVTKPDEIDNLEDKVEPGDEIEIVPETEDKEDEKPKSKKTDDSAEIDALARGRDHRRIQYEGDLDKVMEQLKNSKAPTIKITENKIDLNAKQIFFDALKESSNVKGAFTGDLSKNKVAQQLWENYVKKNSNISESVKPRIKKNDLINYFKNKNNG